MSAALDSHWWEQQRSVEAEKLSKEISRTDKRKRVSAVLRSNTFRNELEGIVMRGPGTRKRSSAHANAPLFDYDTPEQQPRHRVRHGKVDEQLVGGGSLQPSTVAEIAVNDLQGNAVAGDLSATEVQLRCKAATLCRIMDCLGWIQSFHDSVTVRITPDSDAFLINPFGLLYHEITAGSLAKVTGSGDVINEGTSRLGINKAGYTLQSAIHWARPDVQCVIHVHTAAAVAVSAMACGLLPISQEALAVGTVTYRSLQDSQTSGDEVKALADDLGYDSKVVILHNVGVMALGETIEEAFFYMMNLIKACEIQVQTLNTGPPSSALILANKAAQQHAFSSVHSDSRLHSTGQLEFEAHVRALERQGCDTSLELRTETLLAAGMVKDREIPTRNVENFAESARQRHFVDGAKGNTPKGHPRKQASQINTGYHTHLPTHAEVHSDVHPGRIDSLNHMQRPSQQFPDHSTKQSSAEGTDSALDPALLHHRHCVAQSTERAIAALKLCVTLPPAEGPRSTSLQLSKDENVEPGMVTSKAVPTSGRAVYANANGYASGDQLADDQFVSTDPGHSSRPQWNSSSTEDHFQDSGVPYGETLRRTRKLAKTVALSTRSSATSLLPGYSPATNSTT